MDLNLQLSLFSEEQNFGSFEEGDIYDIIIIGGGPAGLTAAVYTMRKGLKTGMVARQIGGQVAETAGIENYLGYRYINGTDLVDKFREQVFQFGISYEANAHVDRLEDGPVKKLHLDNGRELLARTVLIASGKHWKKLQVANEERLTGHGVAYCSICDAPLFEDKRVVVVGGGNSGVEAAIDLAQVATEVTLVQRRDQLTADKILIDRLAGYDNVRYLLSHEVIGIHGEAHVSGVTIRNREDNSELEHETDGVFIEIGLLPNSDFVRDVVDTNEYGEITVNCFSETSRPGIFAAGDVTSIPFKQIIIACGEGAKAALSANEYLLTRQTMGGNARKTEE